ncbi:Adenylate kinase isoenzyme [Trichinella pseudospiralis]
MSSFYNISEIDAFKASACRRLIITVGRVALRQAFEDVSAQLGRALSTLINSPEVSVKWQFSKLNRRENTHICKVNRLASPKFNSCQRLGEVHTSRGDKLSNGLLRKNMPRPVAAN